MTYTFSMQKSNCPFIFLVIAVVKFLTRDARAPLRSCIPMELLPVVCCPAPKFAMKTKTVKQIKLTLLEFHCFGLHIFHEKDHQFM